jgi:hypothetical protein
VSSTEPPPGYEDRWADLDERRRDRILARLAAQAERERVRDSIGALLDEQPPTGDDDDEDDDCLVSTVSGRFLFGGIAWEADGCHRHRLRHLATVIDERGYAFVKPHGKRGWQLLDEQMYYPQGLYVYAPWDALAETGAALQYASYRYELRLQDDGTVMFALSDGSVVPIEPVGEMYKRRYEESIERFYGPRDR